MRITNNLNDAILKGWQFLHNYGKIVKGKSWQGTLAPKPMYEVLDYDFKCIMPQSIEDAKAQLKPNLPWADDHFMERVGGEPLNPPPSHKIWPFGGGNKKFLKEEKFDHTYPERFWPPGLTGIRFGYGDFKGVLNQLVEDPLTRQAYLPIFFPEDTGTLGRRIPCTIGYHFIIRDNRLDITYWMRSLDMLRHFQDDIYLCYRLAHYVVEYLHKKGEQFKDLQPGYMKFHAVSCHIFDGEQELLNKKINTWKDGK